MGTVEANGVELGAESFGSKSDPLVLLIGGTTMLAWPDALCQALAAGGRHVVRYDLRDCGESTAGNPMKPDYNLRDLARLLDNRPAHVAGIGVSGMIAQIAALDHPKSFGALTLIGTRPVAPGPVDKDLPDHDQATMGKLFSRPMPDWADRAAVAQFSAEGSQILGNNPEVAMDLASRIWDRTASAEPEAHLANHIGIVFSKLDCTPRWRERLSELDIPTLVVHGAKDPFFPVGNGIVLAEEIPSTAIPSSAISEVASSMLLL